MRGFQPPLQAAPGALCGDLGPVRQRGSADTGIAAPAADDR
jgi:hypothetical protein